MFKHSGSQRGFTLVELMVVVLIVAVLAAVGIPQYSDYVTRGKISEATANLGSLRVKMEQYFQDNRQYVGGPCNPPASETKYFTYSCVTSSSPHSYTITATGVAAQGMGGFIYTINEANVKATTGVPAGWTSSASCWVTKKNGSC